MQQPSRFRIALMVALFTPSVLCGVIALWFSTGGPFRHTQTAIKYQLQSNKDLNAGRVEAALTLAKLAVQEDPSFPYTHFSLGTALCFKGNYAAAIQELRKANALVIQQAKSSNYHDSYPDGDRLAYYYLGYAYAATGQTAEAMDTWKTFLKFPPGKLAAQIEPIVAQGGKLSPAAIHLLPPDAD